MHRRDNGLRMRPRCESLEDRSAPSIVPVGPEFRVNEVAGSIVDDPSVAVDSNGDFVIAWQSYGVDGSNNAVLARLYDKNGNAFGNEIQVNTFTSGSQQTPAVGRSSSGSFVVVWGSASGQDGSREGVYLRRFNATGTPISGEMLVNVTTSNIQGSPAIAMDPNGDFVVVWESLYQDGDGYGIYARRYNSAGVPQTGEIAVNQTTAGDQRFPSVALQTGGNFVVTWQGVDGDQEGLFARRFALTGTPLSNDVPVNTYTTDNQSLPTIASNAIGDFTVTWQSQTQDGGTSGIYARRFNSAATPLAAPFRVNSVVAGDQTRPVIASSSTGELAITWESTGQDGDGLGVYARQYSANGNPVDSEFRVNSITTGNQARPGMGGNQFGDFVVSWPAEFSPLSGVIAQRYARPPVPTATLTVDDGTIQRSSVRSLTLTFNTVVTVGNGGITLTGPAGPVTLAMNSSQSTPVQTILKLTFSGNGVTPAGLVTGNYTVTIVSSLVTNVDGQGYDGNGDGIPGPNGTFSFHRLYGDIDGNRTVSTADFLLFRSAFGTSIGEPGFLYYFDYDADGSINVTDFAQFRAHFGTSLP